VTSLALSGVVYVRVNWGRWIGDCPTPYCRTATRLGLYEPVFSCDACGYTTDAIWPPYAHDIARLLMMRPDWTTRNWVPGEELHDLLAENMEHGVLAPAPGLELEPGNHRLVAVYGDRITADQITPAAKLRAIGAA
jgi:hypothetical protein